MELSPEPAGIGVPLAKEPGQGCFNVLIELGKLFPLVWKIFFF